MSQPADSSAPTGPKLAVLGNLLLDDVVHSDGATRMAQPGGAALYVALGAALWGVPVGIVSRVGDDYPLGVLEMLSWRGIEVEADRSPHRKTLRTWLLYEGRRRQVVHRLGGPTHAEVSPRADEIPARWRPAAIHLAPMPWSVQRSLVDELAERPGGPVRLSADPYELLTEERLPDYREVFGRLDALFLSEDEMEIKGAIAEPEPVLERLAAGAPRLGAVFYKRGPYGGMVWRPDGKEPLHWEPRAEEILDSTGSGDAFAGGVLAGMLLGEPLARRLERGVVSASFALAGAGPDGLLAASRRQADGRLATWFPRR